ncbi:hypothetical protein HHK36_008850 [Tetracentron sinense]|uniref:Uncharacterized protein n=1 Tax=Tetracentron sinense TaxID=13715 RepID=A0A835DJP8_TETSI|nr:hypothetical protein HHK36_008850 [Tetracentron sinense]
MIRSTPPNLPRHVQRMRIPPRSALFPTVVASQMSSHKNELKLLGCCLETKIPTPVFEFLWGIQPYSWENLSKDVEAELAGTFGFIAPEAGRYYRAFYREERSMFMGHLQGAGKMMLDGVLRAHIVREGNAEEWMACAARDADDNELRRIKRLQTHPLIPQ